MKAISILIAPALAALAVPAFAQDAPPPVPQAAPVAEPELDLEQTMAMRCSIAFALVADMQVAEEEAGSAYPPMEERGREYFVRTMARLMDETRLDRDELRVVLDREVGEVRAGGMVEEIMPACMVALDASGL
jgi:hypothetical protein